MLIRADARYIPLKSGIVQTVVTSPPYWGLRDYGLGDAGIGLEKTPEEYVANLVTVFREVWRVLRDDGTVWLNLGDSYAREGGKTQGCSRHWDGRVRDPGSDSVHARLLALEMGLKPKDLVGIPWRVAFALQADGWYLRSDIIWHKPNPMPESVRDRPTKAHEFVFLLSKSERYYWDQESVREPDAGKDHTRNLNRTATPEVPGQSPHTGIRTASGRNGTGRNIRSVWTIPTQPYSGAHFAAFPQEIPDRCIKAGSKPGDIVLDPFVGSGTTVMVARRLGRVGIGLDLTYQHLSAERVAGPLFKDVVNSAWS